MERSMLFKKIPKRNYAIKDSNFNQLNFATNHVTFTHAQFKLGEL